MCRKVPAHPCAFWIHSAPINRLSPLEATNLTLYSAALISEVSGYRSNMARLSWAPLKCQIFGSEARGRAAVHHGRSSLAPEGKSTLGLTFQIVFVPKSTLGRPWRLD